MSELVLYTSDDDRTRLDLRIEDQTVWLTQLEIAELFQTTKQYVSLHAKNIFQDEELAIEATVKESLTVQTEWRREVQRTMQLYNLDLILAIGYRVRSQRGVQFRQWASTHLKEYLIKGFVMDDERHKNPGGWDYFDETSRPHPRDPGIGETLLPESPRPLADLATTASGETPSRKRKDYYGVSIPWVKYGELNDDYYSS